MRLKPWLNRNNLFSALLRTRLMRSACKLTRKGIEITFFIAVHLHQNKSYDIIWKSFCTGNWKSYNIIRPCSGNTNSVHAKGFGSIADGRKTRSHTIGENQRKERFLSLDFFLLSFSFSRPPPFSFSIGRNSPTEAAAEFPLTRLVFSDKCIRLLMPSFASDAARTVGGLPCLGRLEWGGNESNLSCPWPS